MRHRAALTSGALVLEVVLAVGPAQGPRRALSVLATQQTEPVAVVVRGRAALEAALAQTRLLALELADAAQGAVLAHRQLGVHQPLERVQLEAAAACRAVTQTVRVGHGEVRLVVAMGYKVGLQKVRLLMS